MCILKKFSTLVVIFLLASPSVVADAFQSSVSMSYSQYDSGNIEGGRSWLGLTGYIDEVSTSKGPLALAGFLNKSSFIGAGYSFPGWSSGDSNSGDDSYSLSGGYVTEQDIVLNANYSSYDSGSGHSLAVGKYLDEQTVMSVTFSGSEEEAIGGMNASIFGLTELMSGKKASYGFDVSHVNDDDFNLGLSANSTYYINNRLGVGGGLGYSYTESFDVITTGVQVGYFLNSSVKVSTGLSFSKVNVDGDVLLIGASTSRSGFVGISARF